MSKQISVVDTRGRGPSRSRAVAGARKNAKAERSALACEVSFETVDDQRSWAAARRAGQQRRRRREETALEVLTELPEVVPVVAAELAALEAYLCAEIDAILAMKS
jgi:hypothetical protein